MTKKTSASPARAGKKSPIPDCIPEDTPARTDQHPACSWEPIGDRVIVVLDEEDEEVLESGLVIPRSREEGGKPRYGTVIACGPGVLRQVPLQPVGMTLDPLAVIDEQKRDRYPMQISPGMRVVVSSYAEMVPTGAGKNVYITRENEILSIVR